MKLTLEFCSLCISVLIVFTCSMRLADAQRPTRTRTRRGRTQLTNTRRARNHRTTDKSEKALEPPEETPEVDPILNENLNFIAAESLTDNLQLTATSGRSRVSRTRDRLGLLPLVAEPDFEEKKQLFDEIQRLFARTNQQSDNNQRKYDDTQAEKISLNRLGQRTQRETSQFIGLIEGDQIPRVSDLKTLLNSLNENNRFKRKVSALLHHKWNLRRGNRIQYKFHSDHDERSKQAIRAGIDSWQSQTCIRFRENPNVRSGDYIIFTEDVGCSSYVGRVGGQQRVSIAPGCTKLGTVAHEIGHALGFIHEHSRPDRDESIRVLFDNIPTSRHGNFIKYPARVIDDYGVEYDTSSMMHYGPTAFTRDGTLTIETIDPLLQSTIGQRQKISFMDAKIANLAYCKDSCPGGISSGKCQHGGYTDPNNCDICACPDGFTGHDCSSLEPPRGTKDGGTIMRLGCGDVGTFSKKVDGGRLVRTSWLLQGPTESRIRFKLSNLDTAYYKGRADICPDYVQLRYRDYGLPGLQVCGTDASVLRERETESNELLIEFHLKHNLDAEASIDYKVVKCDDDDDSDGGDFTTQERSVTTTTTETPEPDCTCGEWSSWRSCVPSSQGRCGCRNTYRRRRCRGDCTGMSSREDRACSAEDKRASRIRACVERSGRRRVRTCCGGWTLRARYCFPPEESDEDGNFFSKFI